MRTVLMAIPLALGIGACSSENPTEVESRNIVQVAAEAGSFTTLLAAAEAAGLVGVLQGAGPYTVFAPTDEAFAQLPAGTIEALLADTETLASILTYHVVPGRIRSADIVRSGGAQPVTVQGQSLTIEFVNGAVRIGDATVIAADVEASNGVIHVIDTVLLPAATE
jgi:uncharacterized surface protein with fasciclin (FAS1) repeats